MTSIPTANMQPTYLFANVEKRELNSVLHKLKETKYINWFGSTSGRFDLVASLKGNDVTKTYAAIKEIRSMNGVLSTTCMYPYEGLVNTRSNGAHAMGQVFLKVDKPLNGILKSLMSIPGVSDATVVSGQWDILATVKGESYEEILAKTVQKISQIDGIRTSETSFVYKPTVLA
jgi:DNA-binding Lrp family transcriptional regulator